MRNEDPVTIRLADYRPPDFLIERVEMTFALHPSATRVTARLAMRPNPVADTARTLSLVGDGLTLSAPPLLDGRPLEPEAFTATPDLLVLENAPQTSFELTIETVVDPSANTQLMGLYRTSGNYCTQCEAEGFRRITYFLDRPDVLSVYRVRIEAERSEAPILLSNGNPIEAGDLGDGRHYAVWDDPHPKPSYLFALVGGDLAAVTDRFVTASGREVALAIYVEHGKQDRADYAMDALKRSMAWDERAFGREYDLDVFNVVAVSDFNMGAMENKGLNVFNDKYVLASPETATDGDYAGIETVIAHEYFHNWTGNRITCRDWFQLCLKEGLTVFRDQEFSSDERSRPVKRIADVRTLRAQQFAEDAGPFAHPVRPEAYREINNFYTATIYEKGAEVIRMLRRLIGEDAFRAGMDLYFERHDGEAATIEQFIACFAESSGRDLGQFMRWYAQAGTPRVAISSSYDADRGRLTLDLVQSVPATPGQPHKKPMVIPLAFALLGPDGSEMPAFTNAAEVEGDIIVMTRAEHQIVFEDVPERPLLSVNRGFSAPVDVAADLDDEALLFLARHDGDPFNRWQSLQSIATRLIRRGVDTIRGGGRPADEPRLADAIGAALGDPSLDHAFVAQLLSLPSEADIARDIGRDVDPDAIHASRLSLRRALRAALAGRAQAVYDGLAETGAFAPDAASAGRRALRTALLDLLCAERDAAAAERAHSHYAGADNMTDRMGGLAVLAQIDHPLREKALDDFLDRYRDDALVLDKWFAVQAMIAGADTLERVEALMAHPAFNLANPNRTRALIGSFASANPTGFNRADGAGYRFLADIIVRLDPMNPHTAARLMGAFRTWRTLEPGRRAHVEAALKVISGTDGLSRDVSDLVIRALE